MSINVINSNVPTVPEIRQRLGQAQLDVLAQMKNGVYNGPISEDRLLQMTQSQQPGPAQWAKEDAARKMQIRDSANDYWSQMGEAAKQRWLSEPKIMDETKQKDEEVVEESPSDSQQEDVSVYEDASFAPYDEENTQMSFLESLHPRSIQLAYKGIFTDLKRWNELPEQSGLQKVKNCFFSPERVGAMVCSCLLMIVLIVFIVVMTL